ncbi:helix-turn-helix transcriptional regulator [Streptomyces sp. NPDC003300]|uniref:helix-turn-helix domain-containing protein n=1 Tax=unclassified Streptomyces TaxID=2593676 RepID=UPI0033B1CC4E
MPPRKRQQSPKQKKNKSAFQSVGALLALFRIAAGYTQAELATLIIVSESKLASIEQGRRPLVPTLAQELDRLLETKGALEVAVAHLPEVDVFPEWAAEYMDYEREAVTLCFYANQVLPGLLQTEEYARAVFRSRVPVLGEDEIELQVAGRVDRQDILQRKDPPSASFIIWEPVLHDRLGGDEVYRNQLRHLRDSADIPGVALQIMPLGRTTHASLDGPFVLIETPHHEHLAYAETQRGSQLVHDPNEVSILARKYAMLRTQALNSEETKGLLDRLLGE